MNSWHDLANDVNKGVKAAEIFYHIFLNKEIKIVQES